VWAPAARVPQIAECIETLLPFIQERLLNELSMVLAGSPFVEPSLVLTAPSTVPGSSASSTRAVPQQALCVCGCVSVVVVVVQCACRRKHSWNRGCLGLCARRKRTHSPSVGVFAGEGVGGGVGAGDVAPAPLPTWNPLPVASSGEGAWSCHGACTRA
jgi:hypothetical protein